MSEPTVAGLDVHAFDVPTDGPDGQEREEFGVLDRLGRARGWLLGAEVRLARKIAPTRPHPRVNGELANKLAMPVLGPADRLRDLVRPLTDSRDRRR